jgi:hypothetical protein
MLQQRIVVERERADADAEHGTLLEQLARALDYRRWHQFRVQRLQDGQWRKLSGPASSGVKGGEKVYRQGGAIVYQCS